MSLGVNVPEAERLAREDRELGRARVGEVNLRDFDQGVVETLGATITGDNYFLSISGVSPPPGSPGVPVTFANPEDIFEKWKIPVLVIARDDISPAMSRWHPGLGEYSAPARGANPVSITTPAGTFARFDRYEEQMQAVPFDIMYTLSIQARYRSSLQNMSNAILKYVLKVYTPYCRVLVKDSLGDVRSYDAFMEGISSLDEVREVTERQMGFAVTLRVEGELNLPDPEVKRAVTRPPVFNFAQK